VAAVVVLSDYAVARKRLNDYLKGRPANVHRRVYNGYKISIREQWPVRSLLSAFVPRSKTTISQRDPDRQAGGHLDISLNFVYDPGLHYIYIYIYWECESSVRISFCPSSKTFEMSRSRMRP